MGERECALTPRYRMHRTSQCTDILNGLCRMSAAQSNLGLHMQEQSAALEKARAEAERLGPALQELRSVHHDTCRKCGPLNPAQS